MKSTLAEELITKKRILQLMKGLAISGRVGMIKKIITERRIILLDGRG